MADKSTRVPAVKPISAALPRTPVQPLLKPKGKGAPPSFPSLLAAVPNPLDSLEYPGDVEGNATAEIQAMESFIVDQRKAERDAWRLTIDPDFWCCLVFQSREQRDEFLASMGWADLGPKYLNGLAVAQRLGKPITPIALLRKKVRPMPKALRRPGLILKKGGE